MTEGTALFKGLFLKTLAILAAVHGCGSWMQPSIHPGHWLTADDFAQEWHLDLPRGGREGAEAAHSCAICSNNTTLLSKPSNEGS